jgi:phosphonate transport system substrate-binding protein
MSENVPPSPVSTTPPAAPRTNFGRLLIISLGLVAVAAVAYGVVYYQNQVPAIASTTNQLDQYLKHQGMYAKLAEAYTDADNDLVADPPTDQTKWVNPEVIAFSVVGTDDPVEAESRWSDLIKKLANATGKKVVYLAVQPPPMNPNAKPEPRPGDEGQEPEEPSPVPEGPIAIGTDGQLEAVKAGQLHVTAFNTGLVPRAVNEAGFVPLYCPADKDGKYAYTMEIIVPAESPIKDLNDLKGKTITFTAMSSNSGAKAPMVILKEAAGLLPGRDYDYLMSGDHIASILGICVGKNARIVTNPETKEIKLFVPENLGGKYDVACVASDLLAREVAAGRIKKEQYRSIYTSKEFPPLCFGVPHTLHPELRAKIDDVFLNYQFPGTNPTRAKFVKVNYQKDWEYVREIDQKLTKLKE